MALRGTNSNEEILKTKQFNPAKTIDTYKTEKYGDAASKEFVKWARSDKGRAAIADEAQRISGGRRFNQASLQAKAASNLRSTFEETYKNERFKQDSNKPATSGTGKRAQSKTSGTPTPQTKFPEPSNKELEPSNAGITNKENRIETTGTAQTQVFNINSFLTEVINNDVLPSHSYLVTFAPFRDGYDENKPLTKFVTNKRSNLIMRCESIILPTPSLLEEENIRRYGYGPVEKIPYGVQFSDVAMTWLVDSNSEIIDFMHQWMNTIVMHDSPGANMAQTSQKRDNLNNYRPFEVGYKDGYTNPIVRVYVYNRQQQTVTEYEMFDVFPMNIQSMNLAWSDENQLQKLTVNFAYTNMRVSAPRIVKDPAKYDNLEALLSPYEERRQPTDKGGAAAADATGSPTGESLQSTANASKPNATESKQTAPTGVVVSPNSPQNRVLGP
jgi:hypothetical protein